MGLDDDTRRRLRRAVLGILTILVLGLGALGSLAASLSTKARVAHYRVKRA